MEAGKGDPNVAVGGWKVLVFFFSFLFYREIHLFDF
jgi:hypothetical protein